MPVLEMETLPNRASHWTTWLVLAAISCVPMENSSESMDVVISSVQSGDLTAELVLTNTWDSGYCTTVRIRNDGGAPIQSWQVDTNLGGATPIVSWNADLTIHDLEVSVSSISVSGEIPPGATQDVAGFCAHTNGAASPIAINVVGFDALGNATNIGDITIGGSDS